MSKNHITNKSLALALGASALGVTALMSASQLGYADAADLFVAKTLPIHEASREAAKGEGKCGEGKCKGEKAEGKCGEGKCKGEKSAEGKCGEGKCKGEKSAEGKCGEGKCKGEK